LCNDGAFDKLKKEGITLTEKTREDNNKKSVNPAVRIFVDAQEATRKALCELGLTFATLAGSEDDEVND
jgi:hypothetical protein